MSSLEDLFGVADLEVIVPESAIALPPGPDTDEWLEQLVNIDRREAFFDEHLQIFLTLRVPQPEPIPSEPPLILIQFLSHLQILIEASYIAPIDGNTEYTVSPSPLPSARLNTPGNISSAPRTPRTPRTGGIKKPSHLNLTLSPNPSLHPSILPPSTPNPTPASAAIDQRYLQAEGVVLTSRIWGQDEGNQKQKQKQDGGSDGFYLLWSKREQVWVAVYRTVLDIAFLRLPFDSPLLCLTLSATLRDKPFALASSSSPLASYINNVGGISLPTSPTSPSTPVNNNLNNESSPEESGPPEFNLLAGLYAGPTFAPASSLDRRFPSTSNNTPVGTPTTSRSRTPLSRALDTAASTSSSPANANDSNDLNLSSTRLGPVSRAKLFALPPIEPETPTSSAMITPTPLPGQSSTGGHFRHHTMGGRNKAVLRKSYRKIMETTSGFRVRMRTVFVPAVLLDEGAEDDVEGANLDVGDEDDDEEIDAETDEDPDRLTSGASERTVVLCVEIETDGDAYFRPANAADFVVEKVEISITGNAGGGEDGANATLIGWDTANAIVSKGKRKSRKFFPRSTEKTSFPLYLAPHEQHNLLYAVTFLRSPQEETLDGLGSTLNPSNLTNGIGMNVLPSAGVLGPNGTVKPSGLDKALQRAVTINIFGKPCYAQGSSLNDVVATQNKAYHYPTATFSSRWNCVLDLSLSQQLPRREFHAEYADGTPLPTINALPEPPSPFPVPVSMASAASIPSRPASSTFPSIASVVSPMDRRLGLELGLNSGDSKRASLLLSPAGPATTSMGEKRHTLPTLPRAFPTNIQTAGPSGSFLGQPRERKDSSGLLGGQQRKESLLVPSPTSSKYTPPSISLFSSQQSLRSPTTYEAPPPPPFKDRGGINGNGGAGLSVMIPSGDQSGLATPTAGPPPATPAYPAFPTNSALPPTPPSQGPLIAQGGNLPPNSVSSPGYIGPSVEVRRERGMMGLGFAGMASATPQTPGPVIGFGSSASGPGHATRSRQGTVAVEDNMRAEGRKESIVVSVGLLPQKSIHQPKSSFESSSPLPGPTIRAKAGGGSDKDNLIYPLSTFILDIFVFNRSTWTRRFEVSCPDSRSRRKRREIESLVATKAQQGKHRLEVRTARGAVPSLADPGVLPLENRVRIGPLLPSACQSVRMKFLAVSPGVHSIDTLTLTDVESGISMNLRSVMDVVVHEPI